MVAVTAQKEPQPATIRLHYPQLRDDPVSVSSQIQQAFGSDEGSLGIVVIDDLPAEFPELRKSLFHLIHRLGSLPPDEREKLARPETSYFFGWSHGKEVMNGRPDTQKGSFYVNPLLDYPDVSDEKRQAHPEYYAGNVWPTGMSGLDDFEPTCKALGKIMYDVGLALARACQPFGDTSLASSQINVESLISSSQSNKARLLHYYPVPEATDRDEQLAQDSLCGTHIDHSLLTGLCSAMYLSQAASRQPSEVPAPTSAAGLYIHPRPPKGSTEKAPAIKVAIPKDCLAFQIGEALELLTNGRLAATPHFVSGSPAASGGSSEEVSRETFAFFLQPDVDDVIGRDGETFGAFTKRIIGRHYAAEQVLEEAEN
ncbi:Clavaminate synthase-like protein [Dioszegia hungarica]|uniref:Clavaminate synthase-like protein n=1 Tax=Dioszegia hungarica TaxID=4972 RepID=A0AA38HDK9_9TREE|nr:Clavaminate synthase-like protein [Dioszegia hungarica]KAI9638358.1 Clavaminate synthase-like protein [Dioszegia hungarica]